MGITRAIYLATFLLTLAGVDSAHGRTWQVAQDGSGDFTVIQEAVNAASSGDVIHIGPGRYIDYTIFDWGNVYVWLDGTKSLTFVGAGAEATIIGPDVYASGWTDYGVACDNGDVTIRIENLRIENQNYIGLSMFNSVLELIGCIVERCFFGVNCIQDIQRVQIESCQFISGPHQAGSTAVSCATPHALVQDTQFDSYILGINFDYSGSTDVMVTSCRFTGGTNGSVGMHFSMGAGGAVENCYFTGWRNDAFVVLDAGMVDFRDNVVEDCEGAGVGLQGCANFTMHGNIIDQCVPCIYIVVPCDAQEVHDNHLFRNDEVDGRFIRTTGYYPGGPLYMDFTNNYWGTTDPEYISQWIYDGNDDSDVGMFVVFEPMADGPVQTESTTWGAVKALFH